MRTHSLQSLLPVLLTLLACNNEPSWSSCDDLDCYTQIAVQRWSDDPKGVAADIAAMDDIGQEALVLALAEAHPASLEELCKALPDGPGAVRCHKLANRPHLLGGKANRATKAPGVPGLVDHTGIAAVPSPWTDIPPAELDCDIRLDECWSRGMIGAAERGDARTVASVCNAIPTERFQRECFFRSAEALGVVQDRADPDKLLLASQLCLGAQDYAELCVRELARAVARIAPAADQADPEGWARAAASVQAMRQGLSEHDLTVAERVADRAWSEVLWGSYDQAETLTGIPLEVLPPRAAPHVRATASWFLLKTEAQSHPERDLEAWLQRAKEVLSVTQAAQPRAGEQSGVRPTSFAGSTVDPATSDEPWVHYLGDNYRPLFPDPDQDLLATVLEAAARHRLESVVEQALSSSDSGIAALATALAQKTFVPIRPGRPLGAKGPNEKVRPSGGPKGGPEGGPEAGPGHGPVGGPARGPASAP